MPRIFHIHVRGLNIEKTIEAETYLQAQFLAMSDLSETEQHRVTGFELIPYPMQKVTIERRHGTQDS